MVAKFPDVKDKLLRVQRRRLIATLCRRTRHSRSWFYKVLEGKAPLLDDLATLDDVLGLSANPIVQARQSAGMDKAKLAGLLGISRQALYLWECNPTADRVARVESVIKSRAA